MTHDLDTASRDVSMAKAAASDAAALVVRHALQCHGAIAYTVEYDLHMWMKRAWALASAWGDARFHRARVAGSVLDAVPAN
jgi:alkylation response protein AidB-like acyl-CoA dehydrogenase